VSFFLSFFWFSFPPVVFFWGVFVLSECAIDRGRTKYLIVLPGYSLSTLNPLFLFFILFSPARRIAGVCLGHNSICHDCFSL
jgi:hypothetical protein